MDHSKEPTAENKQTASARSSSFWAFHNDEGYHDSTAGAALARIYREEMWLEQQRKKRRARQESNRITSENSRGNRYRHRKRNHDIQVVRYFDVDGGKNNEGREKKS